MISRIKSFNRRKRRIFLEEEKSFNSNNFFIPIMHNLLLFYHPSNNPMTYFLSPFNCFLILFLNKFLLNIFWVKWKFKCVNFFTINGQFNLLWLIGEILWVIWAKNGQTLDNFSMQSIINFLNLFEKIYASIFC